MKVLNIERRKNYLYQFSDILKVIHLSFRKIFILFILRCKKRLCLIKSRLIAFLLIGLLVDTKKHFYANLLSHDSIPLGMNNSSYQRSVSTQYGNAQYSKVVSTFFVLLRKKIVFLIKHDPRMYLKSNFPKKFSVHLNEEILKGKLNGWAIYFDK